MKLFSASDGSRDLTAASALVKVAQEEIGRARALAEQARKAQGSEHDRLLEEAKQAFDKARVFTEEAKKRAR